MELVDLIREEILAMPGPESTIRELDLARKFQVSRTSVRDALKQLEVEKLIERRRNRGTGLRQFTLKEIADIYDLRAQLEGFACSLAAQKITADELHELEILADAYRDCEQSPHADSRIRVEADDRFHDRILKIADNAMLYDIMHNFAILKQVFSLYLKGDRSARPFRPTPFSHHKILEAIRDGNSEQAEQLMRKHCLWAKRQRLEQFTGVRLG